MKETMVKIRNIGPAQILFGRLPYYPYCNTVWLRGRKTLLVDPGCEEKTLRHLSQKEKVDYLFNTHYHPDHIRYNHFFQDAEFSAPAGDAPCFRSLDCMAEYVGVKETRYETAWKKQLRETFGFRERDGVKEIQDGEALDLGGLTIEFIHLPGHTPGHTGLRVPELKIFFIADMELSPAGPWYSNRRASIDEIIRSIEKIRQIPADYYVPSHGDVIPRENIQGRLDEYLNNIYLREEKILKALFTPRSLDEITSMSLICGFRLAPNLVWYYFERTMITKHLERLLAQGKISSVGESFFSAA